MLRDYQSTMVDQIGAAWSSGARSVLACLPTGGGKTVLGVQAALRGASTGFGGPAEAPGGVLWLAPRRELVRQAVRALEGAGVERLGVLLAGHPRGDAAAPVQVATVQTLTARGARPRARVVVWDEAHHATAATYRAVREAYPDALHLGLTATPERSDRSALGDVFDALVAGPSTAELVRLGYLVPIETWAPSGWRERGLAEDPVEAFRTRAQGRLTVVFASSVPEAKATAERFRAAGVAAECIEGAMPNGARAEALERFARGETRVLTNCQVLTEGWDCPAASCCLTMRGFTASGTALQAWGRVRRPFPGKKDALLIDLRGAVHLHGLPDEPREYSLAGKAIRTADDEPIRQCGSCQRWYRPSGPRLCPHCGYAAPPKALTRQEVRREELQLLRATATRAKKQSDWTALVCRGRAMGYSPGWAFHRFQAKYGHSPSAI